MENPSNTPSDEDNRNNQNPASNPDLKKTDLTQSQNESKYDSHSEKKPHQKTTVARDAKPDRVSYDTRDTTLGQVDDEGQVDTAAENKTGSFPKCSSSSFPSIS